jgi:hypothetical protein
MECGVVGVMGVAGVTGRSGSGAWKVGGMTNGKKTEEKKVVMAKIRRALVPILVPFSRISSILPSGKWGFSSK